MPQVERSPKTTALVLSQGQLAEAATLFSEREDAYKRYTDARTRLETLYQTIAGEKTEWELDSTGKILLVRPVGAR